MMFLLPTLSFWWLRLYIIKMMDYELNLDGWLEDATLFPDEPSDYSLCFDSSLQNEKTNYVAVQDADCYNDLPWYDEKVDLSILEEPKNLQITDNDLNELLSIVGSNSDNTYLSSDIQNIDYFDAFNELNDFQSQITSPENSDFSFSPGYDTITEVGSPSKFVFSSEYEPISEANSPAGYVSDATADSSLYSDISFSPGSISSTGSADGSYQDSPPAVFVTVCDDVEMTSSDQVSEPVSIEEVSKSVRNRKFVNNGNGIPKVQVSLKGKGIRNTKGEGLRNTFHPYSKATSRRGTSKVERKKVQNKEAAARYRIKKRYEEKELSEEVAGLESEQKELKSKHDDLETEIKYLKKLMREILEKKGII